MFGARGVGKTTLLKSMFSSTQSLWFDFLKPEIEEEYATSPKLLRDRILSAQNIDWFVLDEVQRLPWVLNLVHELIESHHLKFAITGSSARKLKRGQANLLAGRALMNHLHPISSWEAGDEFQLDDVLRWGSLPSLFSLESSLEKNEYLKSYTATFVQQEIKAEQVVRKLLPFRRFLEIAAQSHSKIINSKAIADASDTDIKTIQNYYQILEDTMLGFFLEPFHTSVRKSLRLKPKFYFFDNGVARTLARQLEMIPLSSTSYYGDLFESFFIQECLRLNDYLRKDFRFSYLATHDDAEIDLVIERPDRKIILIEIKSSEQVTDKAIHKFSAIAGDIKASRRLIVSKEELRRRVEGIEIMPWKTALREIFT